MGRGIGHGALFDLPGGEHPVAERGDAHPDPAVGAEPGDLQLGDREAHLDASNFEQRQHGNARQGRLPGRNPPLADHPGKGRVKRAVPQILLRDPEGRLGLPQPGLRLDPLDLGQALGVVELFQTRTGVLRLIQRGFGGLESPARRGGIELGEQVTFADAPALVRKSAGDGPGDGEAQGGRRLLFDRTYINGRPDVGRGRGHDGFDTQRIDRAVLFRR